MILYLNRDQEKKRQLKKMSSLTQRPNQEEESLKQ
jgi:hypothetical protein